MAERSEPISADAGAIGSTTALGHVDGGARRAWRLLRRDPTFWAGLLLAGGLMLTAVLAPVLAPYDPNTPFRDAITATGDPAPPSARFPLGTDPSGRDYLSRLLHGGRTSLMIGVGASAIAAIVGLAVAATAALVRSPRVRIWRGRQIGIPVESLLMRITDLWLSFPILLLIITIAFVVGQSVGLVLIIIGMTLWTAAARIIYGRLLILRDSEFVLASQALGASTSDVFVRRVIPHVLPLLLVLSALGIASAILFEATLSYLGAGVPPPTPTWGTMVADYLSWWRTQPRLVLLPGLCITLAVLGFNLLADALRDAMDPRAG